MIRFTPLDWFWALAFLALLVGGAFFFYRLARRSESDFFLAGRGLPWWLPAFSVFSTHTATDAPIWIAGIVYVHGLRGLWYTFFTAWTAVGAFVAARIYRRSLAYTQAEWQMLRFAGLGAELLRGWLAGWQVFMNMFILGWVGIAMGRICAFAFGWPVWVGLVIPGVITPSTRWRPATGASSWATSCRASWRCSPSSSCRSSASRRSAAATRWPGSSRRSARAGGSIRWHSPAGPTASSLRSGG